MHKAFKFRIYPNKIQIQLINKTLGSSRFVFNHFLNFKNEEYKNNKKSISYTQCSSKLTNLKKNLTWLNEVDSIALQQSLRDLDTAYKNFFKHGAGKPKFKKKNSYKLSYRTQAINGNIEIKDKKIKLPKLGFVKFAKSRDVKGTIISATITKTSTNKYFVSILADVKIKKLDKSPNKLGIDLGLTDYLTTSNGDKIKNPKNLKKEEVKLAKLQKRLAKKKKGSKNYYKTRLKVAKTHECITNKRSDFLHKLSTQIINENQVIIIEGLRVKNMLKNRKLAKHIQDASWSNFKNMLEYKANWYGRDLIKLDTFFPSSQLCSSCNVKNPKIKDLKIRSWECPSCNKVHDRDINAALNILNKGLEAV